MKTPPIGWGRGRCRRKWQSLLFLLVGDCGDLTKFYGVILGFLAYVDGNPYHSPKLDVRKVFFLYLVWDIPKIVGFILFYVENQSLLIKEFKREPAVSGSRELCAGEDCAGSEQIEYFRLLLLPNHYYEHPFYHASVCEVRFLQKYTIR